MTFPDHFSRHASEYARSRPRYPAALFDFLAGVVQARDCAWDCATGNGQAAVELARRFSRVIATDASPQQIDQAEAASGIEYRVAPAEAGGIEPHSVDLVTVAQALHWFNVDAFHGEVRRVARPGAVIAVWCYELARVSPRIDATIDGLYRDTLSGSWPAERVHIENGYRDLAFPFETIEAPEFTMQTDWSASTMAAYLRTWSAVGRFMDATGRDPVNDLEGDLARAWGGSARRVSWPLVLKVGRIVRSR